LSAASTRLLAPCNVPRGLTMPEDRNVLGEKLDTGSVRPMSGFYRTGCCETGPEDIGAHLVCAEMTKEFLRSASHVATTSARQCRRSAPPACSRATAGACAPRAGRRRSMPVSHLPWSSAPPMRMRSRTCPSKGSKSARSISPDPAELRHISREPREQEGQARGWGGSTRRRGRSRSRS
jgi:uncharacterized protein (DUF2237 family)